MEIFMALPDFSLVMVIIMKDNGNKEVKMEMENLYIKMEK